MTTNLAGFHRPGWPIVQAPLVQRHNREAAAIRRAMNDMPPHIAYELAQELITTAARRKMIEEYEEHEVKK